MTSVKFFSLTAILGALLLTGCGPQVNSTSRTRAVTRPAQITGANNQVESQARASGININWDQTIILADEGDQLQLEHTVTVNGQAQKIKSSVSLGTGSCNHADGMTYDASMGQSLNNSIFTAVGVSTCWVNHDLHLGLSVMAWNQSHELTQQFILVNLDKRELRSILKVLVTANQAGYLPSWIESLFQ